MSDVEKISMNYKDGNIEHGAFNYLCGEVESYGSFKNGYRIGSWFYKMNHMSKEIDWKIKTHESIELNIFNGVKIKKTSKNEIIYTFSGTHKGYVALLYNKKDSVLRNTASYQKISQNYVLKEFNEYSNKISKYENKVSYYNAYRADNEMFLNCIFEYSDKIWEFCYKIDNQSEFNKTLFFEMLTSIRIDKKRMFDPFNFTSFKNLPQNEK
jgi:hypothetical protein